MYRRDFISGLAALIIPTSISFAHTSRQQTLTEMISNSIYLMYPTIKIHYEYSDKQYKRFVINQKDGKPYVSDRNSALWRVIDHDYIRVPSYEIKGKTTIEKYNSICNDIKQLTLFATKEYKTTNYALHLFVVEEDNVCGMCTYEKQGE